MKRIIVIALLIVAQHVTCAVHEMCAGWDLLKNDIEMAVDREGKLIGSLDLWMKKIILEQFNKIDLRAESCSEKVAQALSVVQKELEKNGHELEKAQKTPGYYTGYLAVAQRFLQELQEKLSKLIE